MNLQFFAIKGMSKKEYGHVLHEVITNASKEQKSQEYFMKHVGNYSYLVYNKFDGDYELIKRTKIK